MDVDDRLPTKYPILYVIIAAFQTGIWVRWCLQIRRMWPAASESEQSIGRSSQSSRHGVRLDLADRVTQRCTGTSVIRHAVLCIAMGVSSTSLQWAGGNPLAERCGTATVASLAVRTATTGGHALSLIHISEPT